MSIDVAEGVVGIEGVDDLGGRSVYPGDRSSLQTRTCILIRQNNCFIQKGDDRRRGRADDYSQKGTREEAI
ncbi:MAG TPA: hypothetical protein VIX19_14510 [Terriglobales bacterium]